MHLFWCFPEWIIIHRGPGTSELFSDSLWPCGWICSRAQHWQCGKHQQGSVWSLRDEKWGIPICEGSKVRVLRTGIFSPFFHLWLLRGFPGNQGTCLCKWSCLGGKGSWICFSIAVSLTYFSHKLCLSHMSLINYVSHKSINYSQKAYSDKNLYLYL